MSRIRKIVAALGMVAVGVVVRCGDDDDDDKEEKRQSKVTFSIYAQEATVGKIGFEVSRLRLADL